MQRKLEASQALRDARRRAGMTQDQVAALAELSVRTVRALESGANTTPRRDSLLRIVAALAMDRAEREDFLSAWGMPNTHDWIDDDTLFDSASGATLLEIVRRSAAAVMPVAVHGSTTVGARRIIDWEDEQRVVTARGRVDGVLLLIEIPPWAQAGQVQLREVEECVVRQSRHLPALDLLVVDIGFGRVLRKGQSHCYQYRIDYRAATVGAGSDAELPTEDICGNGFANGNPMYSLRVNFDPADHPRACYQVFSPGPGQPFQEVRPVGISRWHAAQMVVESAPAGAHGLKWRW